MKKSTFKFDEDFITDNMGTYLEFEFADFDCAEDMLIVIKHTYMDSEDEKASAALVRKQLASQSVTSAIHPVLI